MFSLSTGMIIPGERIGIFRLGMTYQDVCKISTDFRVASTGTSFAMIGEDVALHINIATQTVFDISVFGNFSGSFDGWIGIGTPWKYVIDRKIPYFESGEIVPIFSFNNFPNMYFELSDTDNECDWNISEAFIERIGISIDNWEQYE